MMAIPGYTLIAPVSEDGDMMLYSATRMLDGRPVLLKVPTAPGLSPLLLGRLEHEYEIARDLDPDSIARPIALERYADRIVLVLEQGPTRTLASLLSSPMNIQSFLRIAIGITDALAQLHRHDLVHKDIKPEHVLLDADGHVRLTGLGIASRLPWERRAPEPPEVIAGTLAYISPEQTGRMNRYMDYRTDFYSLGVTLYRMLTLKLPFETDDALGMVHCHIARIPVQPHMLNADIPEMVSLIVTKLMAKMADDRYQSAWGLKADLERCLQEFSQTGAIKTFEPGKEDYTDRLQVPQKLFGREKEMEHLLGAFERVSAGASELLVVTGYAGIGKTALVHEVHRPIAEKRGYFIEGKFDQLQRNVPYSAWIQAFNGFVNYLLMESETQVAQWKDIILEAVGGIGKVVTDVIPNLELIIGPQPDIPLLGATEAQNRFNYVFMEFIKCIAIGEHPLVVFLDDLQWIDAASLNLLQALVTGIGVTHLMVIGAYRDNEVDALHPLALCLEQVQKEQACINRVCLQDLTEPTVGELLAETLHAQPEQTASLTHLLHAKTGGNPFFLHQTLLALVEQGVIAFDPERRRWQWDIAVLQRMEITDNIVTLMLCKIRQLPPQTRQILSLAACLGFSFRLANLAVIAGQSEETSQESLQQALREGLVTPVNEHYQFVHDRIQQAANSLIPDKDRKRLNLEIGKLLLARLPEHDRENKLFTIVDHLNTGAELLETRDERLELARLNLKVGSRAMACTAYSAAARYLEMGISLLDDASWEDQYGLALALHNAAGDAATLDGNFALTGRLFEAVIRHARDPIDMVELYMAGARAFIAQGKMQDATDCLLEVLDRLGVHLKPQPTAEDVQRDLEEVKASYDPRAIGALANLPEITDQRMRSAMRVLELAAGPSLIDRPYLYSLITFKQVKLSIQYGSTPESMVAYSNFSAQLCRSDIDQGCEFGELAMALAEKSNAPALALKAITVTVGFAWAYKRHFRDAVTVLQSIYPRLKEVGNFESAGYVVNLYATKAFSSGVALVELERELAGYVEDIKRIRQEIGVRWTAAFQQAAQNLLGQSACPWVLDGDAYDRQAMLRVIVETRNINAQIAFHVNTLVLCYLFERYDEALSSSVAGEEAGAALLGFVNWYLYDSLTRLALCTRATPTEKERFLEKVAKNQSYVQNRARYNPMNLLNKWHLVEAEHARVTGDVMAAIEHYDRAISLSRENGFIHEEALANELAAKFWDMQGRKDYARFHWERAHTGYSRWQAWAKVKALEAQHPGLALALAGAPTPPVLDLETIMKATHTISTEIEMNKLLSGIMHIVIENAGAQTGFLMMERDGEWVAAARGSADRTEIDVPLPAGIDQNDLVSLGVVRYVARTNKTVVLDYAAYRGEFVNDPHIRREGTKSLLCAPLLSGGRLAGILYLENNLATHAFTQERVQLLEMLLSQAATSLENAAVYKTLKESESKYRRFIDTANEGIWMLGPDLMTTYVNERMAGMIGYPAEQMIGRPFTDFMFEEDVPDHYARMEKRRQGISEGYERRIRHKDGKTIWAYLSAAVIFDENHGFQGTFAMFSNITERKRAEDALNQSEQKYREIFNNVSDGMYLLEVTEDGRFFIIDVNPALSRLTGIPPEQMIGRFADELQMDEASRAVIRLYQRCVETRDAIDIETTLDLPAGRKTLLSSLVPLCDSGGGVHRILAISHDITERKRAEDDRQAHLQFIESLDRINRAIQGTKDLEQMMSDVLDETLSILDCDRAYLLYPLDPDAGSWTMSMVRYRQEYPAQYSKGPVPMDPLASKVLRAVLVSDDPVKAGPGTPFPLPEDISERFDFKSLMAIALHPMANIRWMFGIHQCSYGRVWSPEEERLFKEIGRRVGDALSSLLSHRNLLESEERFRRLTENARDVIYRMSLPDGKYEYVSPAALSVFGYSPEEFYNTRDFIKKALHPDWYAYFEDQWEHLIKGDMPPAYEYQIIHKSGEVRWLNQRNILVLNDTGNPIAIEAIVTNITERKRAEEEVLKLNDSLEQRVKDRTAELEVKNKELERMNRVFVGRELKMVELKKRIKTLEKQSGKGDNQ